MDFDAPRRPFARAWLCGLGTLALHVTVAWALPIGAPSKPSPPPAARVWMSFEPAGAGAPSSQPGSAVADAAAGTQATARTPTPPSKPARHARSLQRRRRPAAPAPHAASAEPAAPTDSLDAMLAAATGAAADASGADDALGMTPGAGASGSAPGSWAGAIGAGEPSGYADHAVLASGSPCAGYFPAAADARQGTVRVRVHVGPDGNAEACEVIAESPVDQGFGQAALACARRLRFRPAHDTLGHAIGDDATLELGFRRL